MTTALNQPDTAALREMLYAARDRTLAHASMLKSDQWLGPYLKIVNPPLWEIGHLGWFQEYWCLRYQPDGSFSAAMLANADARYNSAIIPHAERWRIALPSPGETLVYLREVLDAVLMRLERDGATEHLRYFVQLAVFHEEMHNEAFHYTRQTLHYSSEKKAINQILAKIHCVGDAGIVGGSFMLGAVSGDGFVFDNEKWAHEVQVMPFRMARTAVSNAAFAAFVDDGGYQRRTLWDEAGWRWRVENHADRPLYWEKRSGQWHVHRFDQLVPLLPDAAVIHVNWYEADAYCRWAGRRLPTEAEWEFAASTEPGNLSAKRRYPWGNTPPSATRARLFDGSSGTIDVAALPDGDSAWGVRQMFGNVWEWTADWFGAYPGFVRDPYKEYSEPWFGNHKVLRGGCYATRAGLLRNTWRNFYTPDRRDVLAGFRTCALE